MEYLRLMGLCVIALFPIVLLKKHASEQSILLILAVMLAVFFRCVTLAAPLIKTLGELFQFAGIDGIYVGILLRTVAVSLISHLCAALCRDGGSQALAAVVELSGAVAALVIALPLLKAVLDLLIRYFG